MRDVIDEYVFSHEDCYLLVADMGRFPKSSKTGRMIDVGLSESLMVNVAVGLSLCGKRVFVYGVAGFVLYRAWEQIRIGILHETRPMNISFLNGGGGFLYYGCGIGHYLVDDINMVDQLGVGMNICLPYDRKTTLDSLLKSGINYIRLCPDGVGDTIVKNYGSDIALCSYGWLTGVVNDIAGRIGKDFIPITCKDDLPDRKYILIHDNIKLRGFQTDKCIGEIGISSFDSFIGRTLDETIDHYGLSYEKILKRLMKIIQV